jgi:hypothetical protein
VKRWAVLLVVLAAAAVLGACDFGGALDKCVQEGRCIDLDAGASDAG